MASERVVLVLDGVAPVDLPPSDLLFADGFETAATNGWSAAAS